MTTEPTDKPAMRSAIDWVQELSNYEGNTLGHKIFHRFKIVKRIQQDAIASQRAEPQAIWHKGCPDKIYGSEWFIAETIHGDRVVLKTLPEEYSYDYKTADETYIMAKNIKRWMQFPDSQFITAPVQAVLYGWQLMLKEPTVEMIEAASDYHQNGAWSAADDNFFPGLYKAMLAAAPKPEEKA